MGHAQRGSKEKGERTDKEEVKEDRSLAKQKDQWNSRNQDFFEKVPTNSPEFKDKQNASYIFKAAHEVVAHRGAGQICSVWTAAHIEEII